MGLNLSSIRPVGPGVRLMGRAILIATVFAGCFLLLGERLSDMRLDDVLSAMAAIPLDVCLLALVFGLLSHLALAGYDMLAFTRIGRKVPWPRALAGGFSGTVIGQVLGFGLITGSLARARIYRANGIGVAEAAALSGFVAAGFLSGLSVLLALLLLVDPSVAAEITGFSAATVRALAVVGLVVISVAAIMGSARPLTLTVGKLALHVPDGKWLVKSTLLAGADLIPAALCLAVMLPWEVLPSLAAFVAIYVTGVALGHMIGSPGAAGPFEGVLFLALPQVGAADLAAAIVIYRLIYYLPPFLGALVIVARAPSVPRVELLFGELLRNRIGWVVDKAEQAEAELVYLGDKHVYCPADGEGFVFYGISGRIWLVLGDPVAPRSSWNALLGGLRAEARAAGATLACYKSTVHALPAWHAQGYSLHPLGEEASIDLALWSLDGSARRELRRKLKTARKANLSMRRYLPGEHPVDEMAEVAHAWRDQKGSEQGFSMGCWQPEFNGRHVAICAFRQGKIVAFSTIWVSADGKEWMLDLMRQVPDAPNGAIYAVLVEAIEMAREAQATSFNLCMAPFSGLKNCASGTWLSRLFAWLYNRFNHRHGLHGMRRFKEVFRPEWSQRYLAVPNALAVPEVLIAAHALVHRGGDILAAHETPRTPCLMPQPLTPEASAGETNHNEVRVAA